MKRIALLLAAVVLLIGTFVVGCEGTEESAPSTTSQPPAEEMSAEEIAEAAIAAFTEIDTYQFDMDVDITYSDEAPFTAMTMSGSGAFDRANRKVYQNSQIIFVMLGTTGETHSETYILGDWMYMKTEMPDIPGMPPVPPEMLTWLKMRLPEGYWEQADIVSQQYDLLMDFVEVELLGIEIVNGVECYKLQLTPDMEKLWQWAQLQEGIGEQISELALEEAISDFSIVQWVDKNSYFILKSVTGMIFTIGVGGEAFTTSSAQTMLMHHINELVTIELPPEAEAAEEIPMP